MIDRTLIPPSRFRHGGGLAQRILRMLAALSAVVCLLAGSPARAAEEDKERDPDLLAGQAAMRDGFYDVAERRFEAYLRDAFFAASKAKGAIYYAQSLIAQGRASQAAEWMKERRKLADGTPSEAAFNYWLARAQLEAGQTDAALDTLRDFENRFSGQEVAPAAVRLRAHAYLKAQRREKALETLAFFQERWPRSAEAPQNLLDWAGMLIEEHRAREAEPILQQLVREFPDSAQAARAALWLGQMLSERGADGQARVVLASLVGNTNASPDVAARGWMAVAAIDERSSNWNAVADSLLRVEVLTTNAETRVDARLRIARAWMAGGRTNEADRMLTETAGGFPGIARSGEALLALGDLRSSARRHEAALAFYQQYLEGITDTNGHVRAWLGKAQALWALDRPAESADAYERVYARATAPDLRERALVRAADAQFRAGLFKAAQSNYLQVLSVFPASPAAAAVLAQMAEAQARLGDLAGADLTLRDVEKRFRGEPAEKALLRRAGLQEESARWDTAIELYGEFVTRYTRSPRFLEALAARARLRYRTGDFEAALADCEWIIKDGGTAPVVEVAWLLRMRCLEMKGDTKMAAELSRTFLLNFPSSALVPEVQFWLGEQAFNRRDFAVARQQFSALAKDHPESVLAADALYWAGRSAAAANDHRQAIELLNEVTKVATDAYRKAEARFAQGDALSELGEYAAAILAFDEAVRLAGETPLADLARGRKGDCQFTLAADRPERYREAIASYRAVLDSARASENLKLQADYKMARCLERLERKTEALDRYLGVVYRWQALRRMGQYPDAVWFTRSAFAAAAMKEADHRPDEAMRIYERVIAAGVPAGEDARQRIVKLKGTGG